MEYFKGVFHGYFSSLKASFTLFIEHTLSDRVIQNDKQSQPNFFQSFLLIFAFLLSKVSRTTVCKTHFLSNIKPDAHLRQRLFIFGKERKYMLVLQNLRYTHPDKDLLVDDLQLTVNRYDKTGLIGNNGSGKSTLLRIIAGDLAPVSGTLKVDGTLYYVPQITDPYKDITVAGALKVSDKIKAMQEILNGNATEENLDILNNDWNLEERCQEALSGWNLNGLDLNTPMESLSGGQKTKVLLAGIRIHQPDLILLDEPSNHLDARSRDQLYDYIQSTNDTLLVVSHDRKLLNLLSIICELSKRGLTLYGGNYDFYAEQKSMELNALHHDLKSKEKALKQAREKERETMERQQKLDARGKKKQDKAGLPTIVKNAFKNNAERSTGRIKGIHGEKISELSGDLRELRSSLPDIDKIRLGFDDSGLHKGKVLINAHEINFRYSKDVDVLWKQSLSFQITSGDRFAITGSNGSGKTTLLNLIIGRLEPSAGEIFRAGNTWACIDQEYSLIDPQLTVYEQAQSFNDGKLQEHDVKIRLNRFLFSGTYWHKPCHTLSGGEKMRLILCCLIIRNQAPDLLILDEPTNNLDIQNMEILTAAANEYKGTLLVISHDDYFLEQAGVNKVIQLS